MKAQPGDFRTFEDYLSRLATFGNGQSQTEAKTAQQILRMFQRAKEGSIGRTCACGSQAVAVRELQTAFGRPLEKHVFCADHAELVDAHRALMDQAIEENVQ
jgi:hypothetical protein